MIMQDNWQEEALKRRSNLINALADAHIDAGQYGAGWVNVDEYGNATRIDPKLVKITMKVNNNG